MSKIADKYIRLKTQIGGNREKTAFEYTHQVTVEEREQITMPNKSAARILGELEFVLQLSETEQNRYDNLLEKALDYLMDYIKDHGALTDEACEAAEEILLPLADAAKEYQIILAAHAHIDMNWMWSYHETVAITLATFRSILNIMEEYPDFCFSQSQASVYKIVEEFDPAMMEEIKARIAEGRWEVTATAWVETDKNMPSGESLLRHIQYSKEYLTNVWGVKRLDVDFSPDTFGHSANVPEIDAYGDVKYYYHCRGHLTDQVLYRYKALSGKEVLVHREHNWYNSGIIPQIGIYAPEISKRSGGLKTGLVLYGVGDHGGGPTRRDVERALDMMTWKIFPRLKFGTIHEYFDEAVKVWDNLPVFDHELNFIFQGCYTTQSRIKAGNRRLEASLSDAEHMSTMAGKLTGFPYAKKQLTEAWQNILFNHFHDIITGSCVQDSREYALGLYQQSKAVTNTQIQNAMRSIALKIDTSSIPVDIDAYNTRSEGAGVGFGVENFIGVPSPERGSGKTRIFHIFNTAATERTENVELTVWDWVGDMNRIQVKDHRGNLLPSQLLTPKQEAYWDHRYFRILVEATVPAMGYTTVVLSEKEACSYPMFLDVPDHLANIQGDHILENEQIYVCIDSKTGRIRSLKDKKTGLEMIKPGETAGFTYIESESVSMSAWVLGRHLADHPVARCLRLEAIHKGQLQNSVKVVYEIFDNKIEVLYSLAKGACAVRMDVEIDWRDHSMGKDMIPLLDYRIPLAYETNRYQYDIPAGTITREDIPDDVPALQYGLAVSPNQESNAILISDCKYGYRGTDNTLALTLINSAKDPDPYPERGIHQIKLWLGVSSSDAKAAKETATLCNHPMFYCPSNCHTGSLPMENSLLQAESENVTVTALLPESDGSILVRVNELCGKDGKVLLTFTSKVLKAETVNLAGTPISGMVQVQNQQVTLSVAPYSIAGVKVSLE